MDIALLATGDEIIHGDTLNSNGHALAHALTSEGLSVGRHLSCSDYEEDIVSCIEFLSQNHSVIMITGGLGPTSDDRTRFALAKWLKTPLVEFSEALAHVQSRLTRAQLKMNEGQRQQALFPEGAILLDNPFGSAMGCCYRAQNKQFILLPGPPRECLPMFDNHVLPLLQTMVHHSKRLTKWRLFGVPEGAISEILDKALSGIDCEIGYRLETPYLEFKVRCIEGLLDEVKQIIEPLVRPHIIAPPEQKASERLCCLIEKIKQPMDILDDATGGKLQTLIQRPTTHQWLNFGGKSEGHRLKFHLSGLEEYWLQKANETITHVSINYQYDSETGAETHPLPYRSPLVLDLAAEWLCFRLFHLINLFHQRVA
jgi:nicotinamide-nucleotide amidase